MNNHPQRTTGVCFWAIKNAFLGLVLFSSTATGTIVGVQEARLSVKRRKLALLNEQIELN